MFPFSIPEAENSELYTMFIPIHIGFLSENGTTGILNYHLRMSCRPLFHNCCFRLNEVFSPAIKSSLYLLYFSLPADRQGRESASWKCCPHTSDTRIARSHHTFRRAKPREKMRAPAVTWPNWFASDIRPTTGLHAPDNFAQITVHIWHHHLSLYSPLIGCLY